MLKKRESFLFLLGILICRYFDCKIFQIYGYKSEVLRTQRDELDRLLNLHHNGISIYKYLKRMGYKKVAVYGMGLIGNHIYEELRKFDIDIIGIDRTEIYNNYQIPVYKIDGDYRDVDLIIVTPVGEYKEIYKKLRETYHGKIAPVDTILSRCEEYIFIPSKSEIDS